MVGQQYDIGVLQVPDLGQRLHDLADPLVTALHVFGHQRTEHAALVSCPVDRPSMEEDNFCSITEHIASTGRNEIVEIRLLDKRLTSSMLPSRRQQIAVLAKDPAHPFIASGSPESTFQRLTRLDPILVNQIIDSRMATGHRPEYGSRLVSSVMSDLENIGALDILLEPVPWILARFGMEWLVVGDAVLVRITTGDDGSMHRIGNRRIHGPDGPHFAVLVAEIPAKIRQRLQIRNILAHHCVERTHNQSGTHNLLLPSYDSRRPGRLPACANA